MISNCCIVYQSTIITITFFFTSKVSVVQGVKLNQAEIVILDTFKFADKFKVGNFN